VQQKTGRAAGRVHDILVPFGVEHAHAHLHHMARREKLAFLFFGFGWQKILEGIVHDPQV
jgi:hypothetical protein